MDVLLKYFPNLQAGQKEQFEQLGGLYAEWNEKINVISRKDISEIYERHILHSLAIAKVILFNPGTNILDVGTGGGFPGIPLAILFPEATFHLVDSIGKKIKVVKGVSSSLGLSNVTAEQTRVEAIKTTFDFVISRAVTAFPKFVGWVQQNIHARYKNSLPNGILYLKGGDFENEISRYGKRAMVYPISDFFEEPFFETKKVIHLSL